MTDPIQLPIPDDVDLVSRLAEARSQIVAQLRRRIVGQDRVIDLLLTALFAKGHGLLVGVPGLAKTSLVSCLAQTLSLDTNRIQFTPDLMPSDITGTDVLDTDAETGQRRFRFVPGPVFTNVLLADEINRTPPKTQAALLQAMEEQRVTAGGVTHPIASPYLVFATQNPIEQEGTYPLPEAQLDRFMLQIDVGYPTADDELEIVRRTTAPETAPPVGVLQRSEILRLQELVRRVPAANHVIERAVAIARATRPSEASASSVVRDFVAFGAGPRASQALILGAKARAALDGRYAAEIEDVHALAEPMMRHRLVMNFRAEAESVSSASVIARVVEEQSR